MKYALVDIVLDLEQSNILEVEVPDPGIILHAHVVYVPYSPLVMRRREEPQMKAVPMLVAQIDPDQPKRMRRFVVLPKGQVLEPADPLTFVALVINPNDGLPFAIYEAQIPAVEVVPALPASLELVT